MMTKSFVRKNIVDKKSIMVFGNKDGECLAFIIASFFSAVNSFRCLGLCIEIKDTNVSYLVDDEFPTFNELAESTFLSAQTDSENLYGMKIWDCFYSESELTNFSKNPEELLQKIKEKFPESFI